MNKTMLKRKNVQPSAYSESKRKLSGIEYLKFSSSQSQLLLTYMQDRMSETHRTFAIPPVAIVMVNQVHVKWRIRCLKLSFAGK